VAGGPQAVIERGARGFVPGVVNEVSPCAAVFEQR